MKRSSGDGLRPAINQERSRIFKFEFLGRLDPELDVKREKTVFISYRRVDGAWAIAIYNALKHRGFDVFFDFEGIGAGRFEEIIIENIRSRAHFLVLITPTALDRLNDSADWLRLEISEAIASNRNVVPIFLGGFTSKGFSEFPFSAALSNFSGFNGMDLPVGFFDAAIEKLDVQFLSIPLDIALPRLSREAAAAAAIQNERADKEMIAVKTQYEGGLRHPLAGNRVAIEHRAKHISMIASGSGQPEITLAARQVARMFSDEPGPPIVPDLGEHLRKFLDENELNSDAYFIRAVASEFRGKFRSAYVDFLHHAASGGHLMPTQEMTAALERSNAIDLLSDLDVPRDVRHAIKLGIAWDTTKGVGFLVVILFIVVASLKACFFSS